MVGGLRSIQAISSALVLACSVAACGGGEADPGGGTGGNGALKGAGGAGGELGPGGTGGGDPGGAGGSGGDPGAGGSGGDPGVGGSGGDPGAGGSGGDPGAGGSGGDPGAGGSGGDPGTGGTGGADTCGELTLDAGEECDDGNKLDGDGCSADCRLELGCGDGLRSGSEACDGLDLAGATCETLGFHRGLLRCAADCSFDTSGCELVEICDNGVDDNGDGAIDCADAACAGDPIFCPSCGNGIVEAGEQCDDGDQISGNGCSEHCRFEAGRLLEIEPNDTIAQAVVLPARTVGHGQVHTDSTGDVDYWGFQVTAGVRYRISTAAEQDGHCDLRQSHDTYLTLYDANGTFLAENDDDGGGGLCSSIDFIASTSGVHYAEVSGWFDIPRYFFIVHEMADETEPNDAISTANVLEIGQAGAGSIPVATEADFWSIQLEAGRFYRFLTSTSIDGDCGSTGSHDTVAILYAPDGEVLVEADDRAWFDYCSEFIVTPDVSGTYTVEIFSSDYEARPIPSYFLWVWEVEALCGDGLVQPTEACEDGNRDDGDGCSSLCEHEMPTSSVTEPEEYGVDFTPLVGVGVGSIRHDYNDTVDSWTYLAEAGWQYTFWTSTRADGSCPQLGGDMWIAVQDGADNELGFNYDIDARNHCARVSFYVAVDTQLFIEVGSEAETEVPLYYLWVDRHPVEVEPNDDFATATPLAIGTPHAASLGHDVGDIDAWSMQLTAGKSYDVLTAKAFDGSCYITPILTVELSDPAGNVFFLQSNWDADGCPRHAFTAQTTGTYHARILTDPSYTFRSDPYFLLVEEAVCGDGKIGGTETCDFGDAQPGDGCSASCTVEPDWVCDDGGCWPSTCGNGIVEAQEECDDGGNVGGDGCSAICTWEVVAEVEPNFTKADSMRLRMGYLGVGSIDPVDDRDVWEILVVDEGRYWATTMNPDGTCPEGVDTSLWIAGPDLAAIGYSNDIHYEGGVVPIECAAVAFEPNASGFHYVVVENGYWNQETVAQYYVKVDALASTP